MTTLLGLDRKGKKGKRKRKQQINILEYGICGFCLQEQEGMRDFILLFSTDEMDHV